MANTKLMLDGGALSAWWAPLNYAANPANPTAAELNATVRLDCAIAWDGTDFGNQASTQNSDPSWCDIGNAQSRGFAQFGGSMAFFYPSNYSDLADGTLQVFLALERPGTAGYLILRRDGQKTTDGVKDQDKPALTGDFVNIYKVVSDGWSDVNTGDVNFKYAITFQPQGDVFSNAKVGAVTLETPTAIGDTDYEVGGRTPLSSAYTGRVLSDVAGRFRGTPGWLRWESSNGEIASVDNNGVVTGVSEGTAEITAVCKKTGVRSSALEITVGA